MGKPEQMGKPVIRSHYSHAIRLGRLKRAIARARDIKNEVRWITHIKRIKDNLICEDLYWLYPSVPV